METEMDSLGGDAESSAAEISPHTTVSCPPTGAASSPSVKTEPTIPTSSDVHVEGNVPTISRSEDGVPVDESPTTFCPSPAISKDVKNEEVDEENEEEPSSLQDVYEALDDLSPPGSTCSGGSATDLPPIPGLFVDGVGEILLPLGPEGAGKLKQVARQAPHGRGMETIVDTAVRNTLEVDAEKVTLSNPAWPAGLRALTRKVSVALGVNADLVRPELYKLLLYEPGGFFKKHRDTEKAEGMFATLVVQLPSRFTGGSFVVSHNGKSETFPLAQPNTAPYSCQYVGFYADCEHEILPVESGYRLALVYSLCYTGSEASKPCAADIEEASLVSIMRRLDPGNSLFSIPLDHQYTSVSLARFGVGALKGHDRALAQNISRVDGWEMVVATVEKIDQEMGNGYIFEVTESEEQLTELFHQDGADASDEHYGWLSSQLSLCSWEEGGMILATEADCKKMWGHGESGEHEHTGNAGVTRETSYTTCMLVAFSNEGAFERQCQSDFSGAIAQVQRNPILIDRLLEHIKRSKQGVSSVNFLELHQLIEGRASYWESFNSIFQGLSLSLVPSTGVFTLLTSLVKKLGWNHEKLTPI